VETLTKKAPQTASPPEMGQPVSVPKIWSFVAASVLAAFYLATSLYIASHLLFWIDEVVTVRVAWLPRWVTIWTALGHAADSLPPIYYLIVRGFGNLFGHNEVAARLPSALAMAAGLLITFDCARRLTDGLNGLIALSILPCSFLPYYGYEARPYALYFMFSALALWVWTCTRADRKSSAILFGVVLALAVMVHYYAVLILVPYALWELFRWRPWQPPSAKLIAGLLGAVVPAVLLSPLILSFGHRFGADFYAPPSFVGLRGFYSALFPDGMFLLAMAMIWTLLAANQDDRVEPEPMRQGELIGWLFLCIPLVGFILARLETNAFVARYFICVLPGIAVAFSCWTWRHFRDSYRVSAGILVLLTAMGVLQQLHTARHLESVMPSQVLAESRQYLSLEGSLFQDGKKFIVFSNSWLFMAGQYYSRYPEDCIFLLDSDKANSTNLAVKVALNLASYYPLQFWKFDNLKQHVRETALIQPTRDTLEALKQAGFKVETRFDKPLEVVYLK